jgi:hypothetical protein
MAPRPPGSPRPPGRGCSRCPLRTTLEAFSGRHPPVTPLNTAPRARDLPPQIKEPRHGHRRRNPAAHHHPHPHPDLRPASSCARSPGLARLTDPDEGRPPGGSRSWRTRPTTFRHPSTQEAPRRPGKRRNRPAAAPAPTAARPRARSAAPGALHPTGRSRTAPGALDRTGQHPLRSRTARCPLQRSTSAAA